MLDQGSTNFIAELAATGLPPIHELTPRDARQAGDRMVELYGEGPAMARVQELEIPTADGDQIKLRILVPHERVPWAIVYYHGGGWVIGALDHFAVELQHQPQDTVRRRMLGAKIHRVIADLGHDQPLRKPSLSAKFSSRMMRGVISRGSMVTG